MRLATKIFYVDVDTRVSTKFGALFDIRTSSKCVYVNKTPSRPTRDHLGGVLLS